MANEATKVTDPLGNDVHLLQGSLLHSGNKKTGDIYDDIVTVIQKPAILIRVNGNPDELYYYRSIGWHHTILLAVRYENGRWETYECIENPSAEQLSELMRKGKQLI
jgi:hypothetical protein